MAPQPLQICIDARLVSGAEGGVEQVVIGLASGLSALTDSDTEEYTFLTYADHDHWLRPLVSGACRIHPVAAPPRPAGWKVRLAETLPFLRTAWVQAKVLAGRPPTRLPTSDGTIERLGAEVVHFPSQGAFLTKVPSIYHPHDLQHLHLPQFFSRELRLMREMIYRAFCQQATMVAVATSWTKRDVVQHYGLPPEKVQVVPLAPVLRSYPVPTTTDVATARQKFDLPPAFVFYPAQTWPHKNHIKLLEALALLRDQHGLTVGLVSTGRQNEFYAQIEARIHQLGLTAQVRFLGFVSPLELQCLYKLCRAVVIPTTFEAASFPLWEAFQAGAPAACSNVTALPEQAGNAALVFDPTDTPGMAEAIHRLWTDEALRQTLVVRGSQNVARFSWDRTVRLFRAHYRRIAGRPLPSEDRDLLDAPSLL